MNLVKASLLSFLLMPIVFDSAKAKSSLSDLDTLTTEQERYEKLDELTGTFATQGSSSKMCQGVDLDRLLSDSQDSSYRIRNLAIILLSHCKDSPDADLIASRLIERIESPEERSQVRDTAIQALGGMGEFSLAVKKILLEYAANSKGAIRRENATLALASFAVVDNDILNAVEQLLNAERASSRVVALQCYRALAKPLLEKPEVTNSILERLYTKLPNKKVGFNQTSAYLFVDLIPSSYTAVPTLIKMLEHSPFSRKAVAHTLARIGAPAKSALPMLRRTMFESTGFEQKTLANAIKTLEEQ